MSALKNWNEKAREHKLEYEVKVYNDKRRSGDNENAEPEKKEQSKKIHGA